MKIFSMASTTASVATPSEWLYITIALNPHLDFTGQETFTWVSSSK